MRRSIEIFFVIGADGKIGRALVERSRREDIHVVQASRRKNAALERKYCLDLSEDQSTWRIPRCRTVAFICAGITSLESCRNNPEKSRIVNVTNTLLLVQKLIEQGSHVIYLSTNLVFDGSVPFQKPDAVASPTTEYGRQKAEVEGRLVDMGSQIAIVRLTKVVSPSMPLFGNWIRSLNSNQPINPFSDVRFSPVPVSFVTDCLVHIGCNEAAGIVQISNDRDITYEEAARFIAGRIGADPRLIEPIRARESGILTESYNPNTTLDTSRLTHELQMRPPSVWEALYANEEKDNSI